MNKLEKYFEELSKIDGDIAIINDEPKACYFNYNENTCKHCRRNLFKKDNEQMCSVHGLIEWLAEEYVEQPVTLNKKERLFCELVETGYIARDKNNKIYWYKDEPKKGLQGWVDLKKTLSSFNLIDNYSIELKFDFIKWEDEFPQKVEDLLKLEVK